MSLSAFLSWGTFGLFQSVFLVMKLIAGLVTLATTVAGWLGFGDHSYLSQALQRETGSSRVAAHTPQDRAPSERNEVLASNRGATPKVATENAPSFHPRRESCTTWIIVRRVEGPLSEETLQKL